MGIKMQQPPALMRLPSEAKRISSLFSAISRNYDFLNHLLSLNIDRSWRRHAADVGAAQEHPKILDACTGTADQAVELAFRIQGAQIAGVDISPEMLNIGGRKIAKRSLEDRITLLVSSVYDLPYPKEYFDAVYISFGLRNLQQRFQGLRELIRVLKKGGRLVILEFSPQRTGLPGKALAFYLNFLVPLLGGVISGNSGAYRYLSSSIRSFLKADEILDMLLRLGIQHLHLRKLTFGAVYLIWGVK